MIPFHSDNLPADASPRLIEAMALLDLGLVEEALRAASSGGGNEVENAILGLFVFNRTARLPEAVRCAEILTRCGQKLPAQVQLQIAGALHAAGLLESAYQAQRALPAPSNDTSLTRLYGMARQAARLGLMPEAMAHVLAVFSYEDRMHLDVHRRVFFDADLAGFWREAAGLPASLRLAMRYANLPMEEIVEANRGEYSPVWLETADLESMPSEFLGLVTRLEGGFFGVRPLDAHRHPEKTGRLIEWQRGVAAARIEAFQELVNKLRGQVLGQQLAFARFQASKGRIGCARNHLVAHLLRTPGATAATLPAIQGAEGLIAEFQAQEAECAVSFRELISWTHRETPELFLRDILPGMPPVNRNSGYALLATGVAHYRMEHTEAAIAAWTECARHWPSDDAPVMNAAMLLSGEERWDEASRLIHRLPTECMQSTLWKRADHALRERRTFTISSKAHATPRFPTPTFGGLYSGADEEFLMEHRAFTPMTF